MTTTTPPPSNPVVEKLPNLDSLTLARKEGWEALAKAPAPIKPDLLTRRQVRSLSEAEVDRYNDRRTVWNNNLGGFKLKTCQAPQDDLWDTMSARLGKTTDDTLPMVSVSGPPGLGKTHTVINFGLKFHIKEIDRFGAFTDGGNERWPVLRVGMRGNTSLKSFALALCQFYGGPGTGRGSVDQLGERALDLMVSCQTRLLIIDDLHFLHWQGKGPEELSHHFKFIADTFPVTILCIGVGLGDHGVLTENGSFDDEVLEQTLRWTRPLGIGKLEYTTRAQRTEWHELLKRIERDLLLASIHPGMLAEDLPDYLYERSGGYIGSLMELIRLGCARAIRTGTETLTEALLEYITINSAAEKAREEIAAAFRTRKLTAHRKLRGK